MEFLVTLVSFAVAVLRGGKFQQHHGLRLAWLPLAAFAAQVVVGLWLQSPLGTIITVLSYLALIVFCLGNARHQAVRVLLVGTALNLVVMIVNGGRMPVDVSAALRLGLPVGGLAEGAAFKHVALSDATNLPFLSDIIPFRFVISRLISFGDIFITAGLFLLVQQLMGKGVTLRPLDSKK